MSPLLDSAPDLRRQDLARARAIARGDRAVVEEVYREYFESVHAFVHSRVAGSKEDAEDVLQDTFLTAFERMGEFEGRSSLYTWICGIARNKALERMRARRRDEMRKLLFGRDAEIARAISEIETRSPSSPPTTSGRSSSSTSRGRPSSRSAARMEARRRRPNPSFCARGPRSPASSESSLASRSPGRTIMGDSPLDRNLERLLRRAARPAPPDAAFRERLLETLQAGADARARSARRREPRLGPATAPPGRTRRWLWRALPAALAAGLLVWIGLRSTEDSPERPGIVEPAPGGEIAVAGGPEETQLPPEPTRSARLVGRLTDASGVPIPASIVGIPAPPLWGFWMEPLDPDGRFEIDLPPGRFALYVYRDATQTSVFIDTLEISRGATSARKDLVLPTGVLSGVVVDARTGRPVPGAPIAILCREEILDGDNGAAFGWTDEEGRYRVDGLGERAYRAMAFARGLGQEKSGEVFLPEGGWKVFEDLALSPGGSAVLRVVDAAGKPLEGAMVDFHDESGEPVMLAHLEPFVDEEGRVEVPGARPGRYTARIWNEGAVVSESTFEIAQGKTTETTIRLKEPE